MSCDNSRRLSFLSLSIIYLSWSRWWLQLTYLTSLKSTTDSFSSSRPIPVCVLRNVTFVLYHNIRKNNQFLSLIPVDWYLNQGIATVNFTEFTMIGWRQLLSVWCRHKEEIVFTALRRGTLNKYWLDWHFEVNLVRETVWPPTSFWKWEDIFTYYCWELWGETRRVSLWPGYIWVTGCSCLAWSHCPHPSHTNGGARVSIEQAHKETIQNKWL